MSRKTLSYVSLIINAVFSPLQGYYFSKIRANENAGFNFQFSRSDSSDGRFVDFAESIARSTLEKLVEKAAYIRIVTRRLITSIVYPRLALPSIFANVRQLASSRLRTPLFSPLSLDPGAPFAFQIFFVESSACLREFFAFSIDAYIRSRCQCRERLLLRLLSCARHWSMINKRKNPAQL